MKLKRFCDTTIELIENFENEYGLELPNTYKTFLSKYNGGYVSGDLVPVITIPNTAETFAIKNFFGITDEQEFDLRYYNEKYKDKLAGMSLIIGNDYVGNYILLMFDSDKVYVGYWDEQMKLISSSEEADAYLITDSFDKFMDAIGEIKNSDSDDEGINIKDIDFYPVGSIVLLEGAVQKMMITSRGLIINKNEKEIFFDYAGVPYPEGLMGDEIGYFNHDMISELIFKGYSDEEDIEIKRSIVKSVEENPSLVRASVDDVDLL